MPKFAAGMTPKEALFVQEYLIDLNYTQAALRAGYPVKSAGRRGYEVYNRPHVREAIDKAMAERSKRTEITADMVLKELARIGFADIRNLAKWSSDHSEFVPSDELDEDTAATVQSVKSRSRTTYDKEGNPETTIELEIKQHDKLAALEKIGKHLGMFTEKIDVTSNGETIESGVVIVQLPDNGRDSTQDHSPATGPTDDVPVDNG